MSSWTAEPHPDLIIEHVAEDHLPNLLYLIQQMDITVHMLQALREGIPSDVHWRLTVTGDLPASLDRITREIPTRSLSTTRLGSTVIALADGRFDVAIPVKTLLHVPDWFEPDGLFERWVSWATRMARASAAHISASAREGDLPLDQQGHRAPCPSSRSPHARDPHSRNIPSSPARRSGH